MRARAWTLAALLALLTAPAGCDRGATSDSASSASDDGAAPSLEEAHVRPLLERLRGLERTYFMTPEGRAEQYPRVVQQLVELGPRAVPWVLPELDSPRADTRYFSVRVLAEVGDAALAERMVRMLADPAPHVALAATEALARLRDAQTIPLLFRAMETGRIDQVRWGLLVPTPRPEDRELVPFLVGRLLDGPLPSRIGASVLLDRITGTSVAFDPTAPREEREVAALRYERWYQSDS